MFSLEKLEKFLVIFLSFSLLSGVVVIAYRKTAPPAYICIKDFSAGTKGIPDMDELIAKRPKININTAGTEELMSLKKIGRKLAQRVIDYRSKNGPFRSSQDLKKVKGIGDKLLDIIKDDIAVE